MNCLLDSSRQCNWIYSSESLSDRRMVRFWLCNEFQNIPTTTPATNEVAKPNMLEQPLQMNIPRIVVVR